LIGAVIAPQKIVTDCSVRVSDSMSAVPQAIIVGQRLHLAYSVEKLISRVPRNSRANQMVAEN
jgi:hypothetical protein